jgi:Holliday junction DNA helicase RuvB
MAPAWTHLGFAVPAGVFGQETLDLFDAGTADEQSAPEWISNTQ